MSNKKFDIKASTKLLIEYKTAIVKYAKDNQSLTQKYKDLQTTLSLNQNMLNDFIKDTIGESLEISELINQSQKLWEEHEQLQTEKHKLEIKTAKLQEIIEDTPTEIREEADLIEKDIKIKTAQVLKKEKEVEKLKNELDKARLNSIFKTAKNEVLVTDPTQNNIPMYQELAYTKIILQKIISLNNLAKTRADQLSKEVISRQKELETMKKSQEGIKLENNDNNKTKNNDKSKKGGDAGKKKKKTPEIKNNKSNDKASYLSKSYDEDYEENEVSKAEDIQPREICKTKQKQLELLAKQYQDLKDENEKYEKKVQMYKANYNEIKKTCCNNTNNTIPRPHKAERNDLPFSTDCDTKKK